MDRKSKKFRTPKGMFITIEGPEGSGKSTQAAFLSGSLTNAGWDVVTAREPGGTPVGEAVRGILKKSGLNMNPLTEIFMFEASRAELVSSVIRPALERGSIVVCDRFIDSTVAYQGFARGFDIDKIEDLNSLAAFDLVPDLTILLDVDLDTGFGRVSRRNSAGKKSLDRIEQEDDEFHKKVRSGFHALAEKWPDRIKVVNNEGTQDRIAESILHLVTEKMNELKR